MKYPLPATAVVTVEPSATIPDCQAVPAEISTEPPRATDEPLTVTLELTSLALAIVLSAILPFSIVPSANLALVSVPSATSAALITPSDTFAEVTESSANPDVVTFVSAIVYLSFFILVVNCILQVFHQVLKLFVLPFRLLRYSLPKRQLMFVLQHQQLLVPLLMF